MSGMDQAVSLIVFDKDGEPFSFGDVLNRQSPGISRTLVIFIRHFFCGNCQEYVRRLTTDLAPKTLPRDLSIIVIGCGAPSLISSYLEVTSCPFQLYADPSTQLYRVLGMRKSLSLGSRSPAYIQHSLASGMVKSVVQGLKRIPSGDVAKAGDLSVNGGEFIFVRGARSVWEVSWSHCMMNSRDHTETESLRAELLTDDVRLSHRRTLEDAGSARTSSDRAQSYNKAAGEVCRQCPQSMKGSTSLRRQSWIMRAGRLVRSPSLRNSMIDIS